MKILVWEKSFCRSWIASKGSVLGLFELPDDFELLTVLEKIQGKSILKWKFKVLMTLTCHATYYN